MQFLDILSTYGIEVKQKGADFWAPCPWHEDKNPSFSVTNKEDHWEFYCFSCKRGGGAIKFVSYMEAVPMRKARQIVAEMAGTTFVVDPDCDILDRVVEYCVAEATDRVFKDFADNRGWDGPALVELQVGYCSDAIKMIDSLEIDHDVAARLNLTCMDDVVVFPYSDDGGCFKLQVRYLTEKSFRYCGKARNALFGIDSIRSKRLYVFEGPGDVVVGRGHGVPCVAMSGTTFHEEYWTDIKKAGVEEVVFVPDGDEGGRQFLKKLVGTMHSDINVGCCLIAGDPDEWLLSDKDLPEPMHPIQWWCGTRPFPQNEHERLSFYSELAPLYARLGAVHRAVLGPWLQTRYGDDAADLLWTVVPFDMMAERVVIANCLCSEQIAWESIASLNEECFHGKEHRALWQLISTENKPTLQLAQTLTGLDYSGFVDLENYKRYLERIRWISFQQKAAGLLDHARGRLAGSNAENLVGTVIQDLHRMLDDRAAVVNAGDIAKQVMADLNEKVANPTYLGIPFNEDKYPILNRCLLGFVPTKFILLSGPTGHGKTTSACNWIDSLVFEKGASVGFVTLEMSPTELVQKQLAIRSKVSGTKLVTGSVNQEEYDAINTQAKLLMGTLREKLHIIHGVYDLHRIVSIVKSQIMRYQLDVVFIDYLQLIRVSSKKDRWEQLMDITQTIKTQICSAGPTVVGVSQLSKNALRSDVPEAADQAGSYGMLADPDVAITCRRRTGNEIKDGSNFLFYIDKHRYGVDSVLIDAIFDKSNMEIKELVR